MLLTGDLNVVSVCPEQEKRSDAMLTVKGCDYCYLCFENCNNVSENMLNQGGETVSFLTDHNCQVSLCLRGSK